MWQYYDTRRTRPYIRTVEFLESNKNAYSTGVRLLVNYSSLDICQDIIHQDRLTVFVLRHHSLSVSLYLCVFLSGSVFLSLSFTASLLSVCHCLSLLSICLSLSLCLSLSPETHTNGFIDFLNNNAYI